MPDSGQGPPACRGSKFDDSSRSWSLPPLAAALTQLTDSSIAQNYATLDLDHDGKVDLVVTSLQSDSTVGTTRWLVYPGTGSGFGAATNWTLPAFPYRLDQLGYADIDYNYAVTDLDGDGRPDLVVTQLLSDDTVGISHWVVYPNTGSGFGAPYNWPLPALPERLDQLASLDINLNYTTTDLDGDRKPDLVVSQLEGDNTVGISHWVVYPNTGSGFGARKNWVLPALPYRLAELAYVDGYQNYATTDLDGDGKPDLVVTQLQGDDTDGISHWLVYANTGSGFAAATNWALPTLPYRLAQLAYVDGYQNYATTDLDGDGKPDLVVTQLESDNTVGISHWMVYPGSGSSFGAATSWPLPTLPYRLAQLAYVDGYQNYATLDLDGDRRPDLVVTESRDTDSVGMTHWNLYGNACP
jgi:hypothetical protein